MRYLSQKIFVFFLATTLGFGIFFEPFVYGVINIDGPSVLPRAEIFTLPTYFEKEVGSTFDLPIYLNTRNNSINTVKIELNFDPTMVSIVKSSGINSVVGIWFESSNFDNEKGKATFSGIIPNGINTNYGLITTITFKTKQEGQTQIVLSDYSSANLNDGYGSDVILTLKGLSLKIIPVIVEPIPESAELKKEISNPVLREEIILESEDNEREEEEPDEVFENDNDQIKKESIFSNYLNKAFSFLGKIKDYLDPCTIEINNGNIFYIILFIYFILILLWLLVRRIYIYFIDKRKNKIMK